MCYQLGSPSKAVLKVKFPEKQIRYHGNEIFHVSGIARPFLPVTLSSMPNSIESARWKLIPYWIKTEPDASKYANTLNAESESIFEKSSYKNYISKNRGLLYVTGFFESNHVQGVEETENYFIYAPNREILTLGIIYSNFTDHDSGEIYPTFSIITTKGNTLLEEIHKENPRMPLIIPESKRDSWLFAESKDDILSHMKPYSEELNAHLVFRVTAESGENTNIPDIQKHII